jgi:maleylacetate reductase
MEVVFARGIAELAGRVAALGTRRVLVLAPPSRRFVDGVTAALAAFEPAVFAGAQVHVPAEVVDAAAARLAETGADTVVAIGGGSPIGLAKALKLRSELVFVALPTTYAGSEMTTMYGITNGASKQTGRDPRVRPELVWYDATLTQALPIALSVQSLCNAIAHVISVASTGSIIGTVRAEGLAAAAQTLRSIEELLVAPTDLRAREVAQRGASACAAVYEQGKAGIQHQLAHLLGGATRLDHAAIHACLLPPFVAYLRTTQPALVDELEAALHPNLAAYLHDTLVRAGAPSSLAALGATREAVTTALATRPELPAAIALAALDGYL